MLPYKRMKWLEYSQRDPAPGEAKVLDNAPQWAKDQYEKYQELIKGRDRIVEEGGDYYEL